MKLWRELGLGLHDSLARCLTIINLITGELRNLNHAGFLVGEEKYSSHCDRVRRFKAELRERYRNHTRCC